MLSQPASALWPLRSRLSAQLANRVPVLSMKWPWSGPSVSYGRRDEIALRSMPARVTAWWGHGRHPTEAGVWEWASARVVRVLAERSEVVPIDWQPVEPGTAVHSSV